MLSPCRWHYSHTKSYVPRPVQPTPFSVPVPGLRCPVSVSNPIPDQSQFTHPAGPATNCQYLYLTGLRDETDRHTHTPAITPTIASHSSKQASKQASGQGLYLPSNQTRSTIFKPTRTTYRNIAGNGKWSQRKRDNSPSSLRAQRLARSLVLFPNSIYMLSFFCFGCRQGHPYTPLRQETATLKCA